MLTDRFHRTISKLRLSVTDRCPFNCLYCGKDQRVVPKELLMSFEEIVHLVSAFSSLGIRELRITGGEPLQRKHLSRLIRQLQKDSLLKRISMTTNGLRLAEEAEVLKGAGLDDVNISLDTLNPIKFLRLTGVDGLSRVLAGIRAAKRVGLSPKLNTVLIRGINEDEILSLLQFAGGLEIPIRFIEWMPVEGVEWNREDVVTEEEVLSSVSPLGPVEVLPSSQSPAQLYRIVRLDALFGVIPTVSRPFCHQCNRIRVSAKGELFTCLFSCCGIPLKPYLKSPDLPRWLRKFVAEKEIGFVGQPERKVISMVHMGG